MFLFIHPKHDRTRYFSFCGFQKKNTCLGMMIVVDDGPHPIINIVYTHQHSLPV